LLGHSGAGKSTLLAALAAVIPNVKKGELAGRREIFGRPLGGLRPQDLAREVAFVFEDFDASLVATTVEAEVAFGPRYLGLPPAEIRARVENSLATCGLAGLEARRVETLSGGQKQRLAVAAALASDARLVLFDEAATDLDPAGKAALAEIMAALAEQGRTVITADNDGAGALALDRVLLLGRGEAVARGEPAAVLADETLCRRAGVAALPFLRYFERGRDGLRLRPGVRVTRPERPPRASRPPAGPPAITASALAVTYPNGVRGLAGLDVTVGRGEFLAVVGENGGGKTTFAKAVAGLLKPSAGRVEVEGEPPAAMPARRRAGVVGYLFQNPDHQIFQPTVAEEVAFGPRLLGLDGRAVNRRVASALAAVAVTGREDEDPFALPKGDRQRVALASVLAMAPAILVMDEPTTGLDRREVTALMDAVAALNAEGTTVVFITHAMDVVAEYARRVVVVARGRAVAEGPPREVLRDGPALAAAGLEPPLAVKLATAAGVDAITGEELNRALTAPDGQYGNRLV
jgi:energy-coupling factor transporter ATP-binding protein EcfA2